MAAESLVGECFCAAIIRWRRAVRHLESITERRGVRSKVRPAGGEAFNVGIVSLFDVELN